MIGHYINLIFRGNSILRWNNFPRIEEVTITDNIAFVLHIIILLSNVLKEKEWIKINELYIFKKLIFDSFLVFILSDINSDVKSRIKAKNPEIYEELDRKIYNYLLQNNIPDSIKDDINFIYNNKNNSKFQIEHDIINFAKQIAITYEVMTNKKVYEEVYEWVFKSIENKLNVAEFKIFLKYINPFSLKNNPLEKYLLSIRRLQSNFRRNMYKRIHPVSVMSHLYITFFLVYIIGKLEEKNDEDLLNLLYIAIFHDIPEAITWDIVWPTKKAAKWLEELISKVENDMLEEYLLIYLDWWWFKNNFKKFILNPWKQENWKLAKIADIFSSLFEAKLEVSNDIKFEKIYQKIVRQLYWFQNNSIDYILKFWVEYFDDNLEDVIKL